MFVSRSYKLRTRTLAFVGFVSIVCLHCKGEKLCWCNRTQCRKIFDQNPNSSAQNMAKGFLIAVELRDVSSLTRCLCIILARNRAGAIIWKEMSAFDGLTVHAVVCLWKRLCDCPIACQFSASSLKLKGSRQWGWIQGWPPNSARQGALLSLWNPVILHHWLFCGTNLKMWETLLIAFEKVPGINS